MFFPQSHQTLHPNKTNEHSELQIFKIFSLSIIEEDKTVAAQ
jgi:hypothetical protein